MASLKKMILACGTNEYNQLIKKSNAVSYFKLPSIWPPLNLQINPSTLQSCFFFLHHTVIITRKGLIQVIGNNKEYQISGSLPPKVLNKLTKLPLKDNNDHQLFPISVVCGFNYTLFLVSKTEKDTTRHLVFFSKEKSQNLIFIDTGIYQPVSLFGGSRHAAAIDTEGGIIIINESSFLNGCGKASHAFLPDGEVASNVACCVDFLFVLSANGRVFMSPSSDPINFVPVEELSTVNIKDISGTFRHLIAVSNDGRVFAGGLNTSCELGLGYRGDNSKFTVISALKDKKVVFASAGCDHSIFLTSDGKIFSCGSCSCNQTINSSVSTIENLSTPVECSIPGGASFFIAGDLLSVVFYGEIPPGMPNRKTILNITRKEPINLDVKLNEREEILSSENDALKAQVMRLKKEISDLVEENSALKSQLSEKTKEEKKESTEKCQTCQSFKILDSETIHSFRQIREIGCGGSGRVFEVGKEEKFALKMMNEGDYNITKQRSYINEIEILQMLKHPNIITSYGIFLSDETTPLSILFELCVDDIQHKVKQNKMSRVESATIIYQIAACMRYVHSRGIIHKDLKPQNILIGKDGLIRLTDFGISKLMDSEEQSTTLGVGTQRFMAPELLNEKEYDEKVDVYSFGVVVFFILSGGELPKITIIQVGTGKKAEIPPAFTPFARDLIDKCWNFDAKTRPSFKEINELLEINIDQLVELSKQEINEVHNFVKMHKERLPQIND